MVYIAYDGYMVVQEKRGMLGCRTGSTLGEGTGSSGATGEAGQPA